MIHYVLIALVSVNSSWIDKTDAKQDLELMQGDWVIASAELSGKPMPEEVTKTIKLTIEGDKYIVSTPSGADKGVCQLNSEVSPRTLEITGVEGPNKGKKIPAIYEVKDGELKVCYDLSGKEFPKEFKSTDGTLLFLVTYTKVKK